MVNTAVSKFIAPGRLKFIVGGVVILAAIIYLIISQTQANSQYYMTIQEMQAKGNEIVGRDVNVSGSVLGDTIQYNADQLTLTFTVAHIPGDNQVITEKGGIAQVLHDATLDPSLPRLKVVYHGVKPDLLKNEAQAIMTGKLGEDGIFYATDLLLKCPTKYENAPPTQTGQ
jgi:cytochrome c-type biogenesis protein CcmE